MKVYEAIIATYYQWGEPSGNDFEVIGIFSDPGKAYTAAEKRLRECYSYDEKSDTWSGAFADEAWIEIGEIQVDGDPEKNENNLGIMGRDENGVWFNKTKRDEEDFLKSIKEA